MIINLISNKRDKHSLSSKKIQLWFPNIFQFKGGVQVYSAFLLEALKSSYSQMEYNVFLKHDIHCLASSYCFKNIHFHYAGSWHKKIRTIGFAAQIVLFTIWKKPNLIISSHINFSVLAYFINRLLGIPYWTVVHGVDAWNITNPALSKALFCTERILAVSNYTKDRLIKEQKLNPNKISILPNTFDINKFQIAKKPKYLLDRYGLKSDQLIILTVARLAGSDRYKGYDQIIQALPKIRSQIPNIHYVLAGQGKDKARIEKLIIEHNLQDAVTLTGFVEDQELCDHYNLCDVFAMPSQKEGFGIVFLESLACGKPTLGGNQDGAVDALCNGELGALVDPLDQEEITQTLIQILQGNYSHPLIYQPEILRQKVIDTFGFTRFTETLKNLIANSSINEKFK
jgi:glycosyltransferase involved in cell wall biosynthesis